MTSPSLQWDPRQYAVYADERARPFFELVARIDVEKPAEVVDLGCGPGGLTATVLQRWPDARVVGVELSADMIAASAEHAVPGRLSFVHADVATWQPAGPVDVVLANAVFQWVPAHLELLPSIVSWLRPGGALAFQVPDNFDEPSHTLLRDLRTSTRWRDQVGTAADRSVEVERPETYLETLLALGLTADVWQTTYLHVLAGEDAVLEWVKGTALRPVLSALRSDEDRQEFLGEYAASLRSAYPSRPWGTLFTFRRTFAVARRPR